MIVDALWKRTIYLERTSPPRGADYCRFGFTRPVMAHLPPLKPRLDLEIMFSSEV